MEIQFWIFDPIILETYKDKIRNEKMKKEENHGKIMIISTYFYKKLLKKRKKKENVENFFIL